MTRPKHASASVLHLSPQNVQKTAYLRDSERELEHGKLSVYCRGIRLYVHFLHAA